MPRSLEWINLQNLTPKINPNTPKEYTPTPKWSIAQIFGVDTLCEMEKFGLGLPVFIENPKTKKNEIYFSMQEGLMCTIEEGDSTTGIFKIMNRLWVSLTSDTISIEIVPTDTNGNDNILKLKATNKDGTSNAIVFSQDKNFQLNTPAISICF